MHLWIRRRAIFVRQVNGTYQAVAVRRWLTDHHRTVKYNKRPYTVDYSKVSYIQSGIQYFFIDVEKGQITFSDSVSELDPSLHDLLYATEIVRQAVQALGSSGTNINLIIGMVLGAVAGIPLGIVIAPLLGG